MTRRIIVAILGIMLLVTGCSTIRVSQDYRTDIDFSIYHTYDWKIINTRQESGDIRLDNPLLHERFHQAIDRFLALRGYPRQGPADFLITYSFAIQTKLESESYGSHVGVGFGRRHRYGEVGFGDYLDIEQYDVGTLAINFYDALSETLIWRGVGSERFDIHATPEETSAFVDRLVTAILTQFPPRKQ